MLRDITTYFFLFVFFCSDISVLRPYHDNSVAEQIEWTGHDDVRVRLHLASTWHWLNWTLSDSMDWCAKSYVGSGMETLLWKRQNGEFVASLHTYALSFF